MTVNGRPADPSHRFPHRRRAHPAGRERRPGPGHRSPGGTAGTLSLPIRQLSIGRRERASRLGRDRSAPCYVSRSTGLRGRRHLLQQCRLPRACAATAPLAWSSPWPIWDAFVPGAHRIETRVGVVSAVLHESGEVTVNNVAELPQRAGVAVNVPGHGQVRGDVAWGGNWFFLVQDHKHGTERWAMSTS